MDLLLGSLVLRARRNTLLSFLYNQGLKTLSLTFLRAACTGLSIVILTHINHPKSHLSSHQNLSKCLQSQMLHLRVQGTHWSTLDTHWSTPHTHLSQDKNLLLRSLVLLSFQGTHQSTLHTHHSKDKNLLFQGTLPRSLTFHRLPQVNQFKINNLEMARFLAPLTGTTTQNTFRTLPHPLPLLGRSPRNLLCHSLTVVV